MSKVKTWQERVLRDKNALPKREMQAEIDELRAKLAAAETSANELRRAVAELIGADPETWPNHGNAPLAIAACVALRQAELAALKAQEPVAWTLGEELGFLDKTEHCSATMFSFKEPDQAFIPLFLAAGAEPNKQVIEELEQLKAKLAALELQSLSFDDAWASLDWAEWRMKSIKAVVAELLRLTAGAAPAQQEPVGHVTDGNGHVEWYGYKPPTSQSDIFLAAGATPVPEGYALLSVEAIKRTLNCLNTPERADLRLVLRDLYAAAAPVQQEPPTSARVRCFNCGNDQTVEFSYAKSAPAKEQA